MGPRLFQEFTKAADLRLGGAAALRCEAVIAAAVVISAFVRSLSFANFDD
jgi:hypothetical protein